MKEYTILATAEAEYSITVEAENPDQARDIAESKPISDWTMDCSSDGQLTIWDVSRSVEAGVGFIIASELAGGDYSISYDNLDNGGFKPAVDTLEDCQKELDAQPDHIAENFDIYKCVVYGDYITLLDLVSGKALTSLNWVEER